MLLVFCYFVRGTAENATSKEFKRIFKTCARRESGMDPAGSGRGATSYPGFSLLGSEIFRFPRAKTLGTRLVGGCTSPGWVLISALSIWDGVSIMGPGITVHATRPATYSGQQRKWCNYVDDMLLCSF